MGSQYRREYVMLRAPEGRAGGFARMEYQRGHLTVTLQLTRLDADCPPLRALLLAGDASTGAVIDLGCTSSTGGGQAHLRAEVKLEAGALRGCHTIAVTSDWPEARLIMTGRLPETVEYPLCRVQESIRRYLSVPPAGTFLRRESPGRQPLFHLQQVVWPQEIAELKAYFDALPPSAPFDAPGWRFVRVALHSGRPEGWCEVGVRVENHAVAEAAYALPGAWAERPPDGLQGYQWHRGRNGQGYWLMRQPVPVTAGSADG